MVPIVAPFVTIEDVALALALVPATSTRKVVDVSLDTTLNVLLSCSALKPPVLENPFSDKNTPLVISAFVILCAVDDPEAIVCTSRFLVPLLVVTLASKAIPSSDDIAVIELAFAVIRPSLRGCHVLPFQRYILF